MPKTPTTKKTAGRKPEEKKAFDKTTMIRLHEEDYAAFQAEAERLGKITGLPVSVGAYLRMAGRAMLGKKIHP
jgi:hypothetical protein